MKFGFLVVFILLFNVCEAQVMIYEFYGNGGIATARYNNDYVVLYNSGGSAQSLNGWSLQYASGDGPAATSNWDVFSFNSAASIPAGEYFLLIVETTGTGGVSTPSVSLAPTGSEQYGESASTTVFGNGGLAGSSSGKIALLNTTTPLVGPTPLPNTDVIDFVGYTNNQTNNPVSQFEGSNPSTSSTGARAVYRNNGNDTNDNGADFARTPLLSDAAFPVSILSFEGKQMDFKVKLMWSTADELNNDGFNIQKSFDAKSFETIGFIKGQNENSTYTFEDLSPKEGYNYYRLAQKDFDGTITMSKIIQVLYLPEGELKVFPNPAIAGEQIQIQGLSQNLSFEVFDQKGREIPAKKESNNVKLQSGNYVFRIYHPYGTESKRVIVR